MGENGGDCNGLEGLHFEPAPRFAGLPSGGFALFAISDRERRRHQILAEIHPALAALGRELRERLGPAAARPLHAHLPRLDWPRGYQPFCTWLALSDEAHGYQAGPQLNVGVHADHVAIRLGWDTAAAAFGRFEFLCRHGALRHELLRLASERQLRFRVYAACPWPRGAEQVFESTTDLDRSFAEARRRGVWWELGRRYELPAQLELVSSPEFAREVEAVFAALLPCFERITGAAP